MKLYDMELDGDRIPHLVAERSFRYPSKISTPDAMVNMLNTCFNLSNKAEEHVYLMSLDNKNSVTGVFLLSKGTVNGSFCNTREVFIRLCAVGAVKFVIAHNHPSGDCSPSKEDICCFRKLKETGNMMGIICLDSLIVSDNCHVSMLEMGY